MGGQIDFRDLVNEVTDVCNKMRSMQHVLSSPIAAQLWESCNEEERVEMRIIALSGNKKDFTKFKEKIKNRSLGELNLAELKSLAQGYRIRNYCRLRKGILIDEIIKARKAHPPHDNPDYDDM